MSKKVLDKLLTSSLDFDRFVFVATDFARLPSDVGGDVGVVFDKLLDSLVKR
jgi:hypothetical protein